MLSKIAVLLAAYAQASPVSHHHLAPEHQLLSPEEEDVSNSQATYPPIANVHLGGHNLQLCQGDCDSDADCAPGLSCYQRDGTQAVPGCSGADAASNSHWSGWDYCIGPHLVNIALTPPAGTLEKCEGDCDTDADCKPGLKCFQREAMELIPGCPSLNINRKKDGITYVNPTGWDYCIEALPPPIQTSCANIYTGTNLDGTKAEIAPGQRVEGGGDMNRMGFGNDAMSSIEVKSGCTATVCKDWLADRTALYQRTGRTPVCADFAGGKKYGGSEFSDKFDLHSASSVKCEC